MPLDPPLPVSATYSPTTRELRIVWDHDIAPGPLFHGNWHGHYKVGLLGQFTGTLHLSTVGPVTLFWADRFGVGFGPSRVSYHAAPADVTGVTGVPAAAFFDFPLTALP